MTDQYSSSTVAWLMKLSQDIDTLREKVESLRSDQDDRLRVAKQNIDTVTNGLASLLSEVERKVLSIEKDLNRRLSEVQNEEDRRYMKLRQEIENLGTDLSVLRVALDKAKETGRTKKWYTS